MHFDITRDHVDQLVNGDPALSPRYLLGNFETGEVAFMPAAEADEYATSGAPVIVLVTEQRCRHLYAVNGWDIDLTHAALAAEWPVDPETPVADPPDFVPESALPPEQPEATPVAPEVTDGPADPPAPVETL